ncbi:hypothetical protein BDV96DRAFT_159912 [Lophiotrema nucula]|uniref:U6 snRNA-associated Sm-like protein LSm6 n=1 Tax=Lophiotrema nucula TaxID=690887 RepID=A0A6A5Z1U5_9PLEO|nr:hypothetical protein BDV96DRAFT_159912 [Lophiotrema nucula]
MSGNVNGSGPVLADFNQAVRPTSDPSGFLSEILGAPVTVKLNSGIVFKGDLQSVDGYMNIALERCREVLNGKVIHNWGDAFIRGNNVSYVCADNAITGR